jgi:hypothetical protein
MSRKNRNRQQREERESTSRRTISDGVLITIITVIGTLIGGLIAFPPIVNWWNNRLNPTPNPIFFSTETFTPSVFETPILTLEFTSTVPSSETITPTFTEMPTALKNSQIMFAQMTASASEGKVPFTVNFNAKSSYVDVQGGDDLFCTFENVCNYTWSVRLDGNNVYGPTLGGSAFSYTFSSKGSYIIVVNVCRGKTQEICNFAFATFTAK